MINKYSRTYKLKIEHLVYEKIAESPFKKINGSKKGDLLVRTYYPKNLLLIQRDYDKGEDIIKVHGVNPEVVESKLEKITGVNLSQYRVY